MKTKILLFFGCICLTACSDGVRRQVEYVDLVMDKEITHFSDSSFFNMIWCMEVYDGDIYVLDQKRCEIFRMDQDMNLLNTIGRQGHGPEELGNILYFTIANDTLYVGDAHKQHMAMFTTDGQYAGDFETGSGMAHSSRFNVSDRHLYYSYTAIDQEKTMVDYALDRHDYEWFGNFTQFSSPLKTKMQNERAVFAYGDKLVVAPYSIPQIEIYDKRSKKPVRTFDLLTVAPIRAVYDKMINDPMSKQENTAYKLIWDSYLHRDNLYLLCTLLDQNQKITQSAILEFDLSGEQIRWTRQLHPGGNAVSFFCVTDDYVYGFVQKYSSIRRYPLNR